VFGNSKNGPHNERMKVLLFPKQSPKENSEKKRKENTKKDLDNRGGAVFDGCAAVSNNHNASIDTHDAKKWVFCTKAESTHIAIVIFFLYIMGKPFILKIFRHLFLLVGVAKKTTKKRQVERKLIFEE
jgi:hypothetical protein